MGRPGRIYIPASSLSTGDQDIVQEPRASVPNMSSTPVIATAAAVICPIRQPRGPPPIEALLAKPMSKQEDSKNFAARGLCPQISGFVCLGGIIQLKEKGINILVH
jgi:hypothetical protein